MKKLNEDKQRGVSECPPVLQRYLDLLNALPGDRALLTVAEVMDELRLEFSNEDLGGVSRWDVSSDENLLEVEKTIAEHYRTFPSSVRKFLFKAMPKMLTEQEAKKSYPSFFEIIEHEHGVSLGGDVLDLYIFQLEKFLFTTFDERVTTLKSLRGAFRALGGMERGGEGKGVPTLGAGVNLAVMPSMLRIAQSGFLEFGGNDISDSISRGEIDARRIRTCPICGHFFWATRMNRTACSSQHAATLRQQRYRGTDKEKDNARRRENRRYLNKLKGR